MKFSKWISPDKYRMMQSTVQIKATVIFKTPLLRIAYLSVVMSDSFRMETEEFSLRAVECFLLIHHLTDNSNLYVTNKATHRH